MSKVQTTLHGTLVGRIWMPAVECTKPVTVDLTRERGRYVGNPISMLRTLIGSVCNDGDFQSASLTSDSFLELKVTQIRSRREVTRRKYISLSELPSIADYLDARDSCECSIED